MIYTPQQLEEKYQLLPENLKEAMVEVETAEKIYSIGQKNSLHVDQIGQLADEVGLIMLGLTKSEEFMTHIKNRLQLDQTTAEIITREINDQIFLPIRESLMKLHAENNDGVETIQAPNPVATPGAGDLPDRDKLLNEIENPDKSETDKVFEKKLGQLFRIPREEVDLDPYSEKPE